MADFLKAIDEGNLEQLLAQNPDLEAKDQIGRTPLLCAALRGNLQLVKKLVEMGSSITATDNNGTALANFAGFSGNLELLRYLHQLGVDLKANSPDGLNALALASAKVAPNALLGFVVELDLMPLDESLLSAAVQGRKDLIEILVKKGANVHTVNEAGETPLHLAARKGHIQAIEILLALGADRNLRDGYGYTPLQTLFYYDKVDPQVVQALGYAPDQVDHLRNHLPSISQSKLNEQLQRYCNQTDWDLSFVDDEDNCSGWSFLHCYDVSTQREDEFYEMLYAISKWDGHLSSLQKNSDLPDRLKVKYKNGDDLFQQVVNDLAVFQSSEAYRKDVLDILQKDRVSQFDLLNTDSKVSLKQFLGIKSSNPDPQQIRALIEVLRKYPGISLDMGIRDVKGSHALSIYVTKDAELKFYNSNFEIRTEVTASTNNVVHSIMNALSNKIIDYNIQVLQFYNPKLSDTIDNKQLLRDLAALNPAIGSDILINAMFIYSQDSARLQQDIRNLLDAGISIDLKSSYKEYTPLEYAKFSGCSEDTLEAIEDAIEKSKKKTARTALHFQSRQGNTEPLPSPRNSIEPDSTPSKKLKQ